MRILASFIELKKKLKFSVFNRCFRCVQYRDCYAKNRLGSHRISSQGSQGRGTKGESFSFNNKYFSCYLNYYYFFYKYSWSKEGCNYFNLCSESVRKYHNIRSSLFSCQKIAGCLSNCNNNNKQLKMVMLEEWQACCLSDI